MPDGSSGGFCDAFLQESAGLGFAGFSNFTKSQLMKYLQALVLQKNQRLWSLQTTNTIGTLMRHVFTFEHFLAAVLLNA